MCGGSLNFFIEENMMTTIPISVCIIAKNEEKHIAECLKRLHPYNMELVVADTGSTDATKELARQYADKVLDVTWTDSFSDARNSCAAQASNNWILAIDCDEYVTQADMDALKAAICAYPKHRGSLRIHNLVAGNDAQITYVTDDVPRLYDRRYYEFANPIHEQIVPKNLSKEMTEAPCFPLPIEVIHYGYALPPAKMKQKQERNLKLLYHQLATQGENPYICFQIAQSELVLNNYENAIRYYEKGLNYNPSRTLTYVQYMIEGLAKAYVCAGYRQKALALMARYEPECGESAKYAYYYANVLMDNQEPLKALMKYVKATVAPDAKTLGDELANCYRHIVELYHRFGEDELCAFFQQKYEECLQQRAQMIGESGIFTY